MAPPLDEGWYRPINVRLYHYFRAGRSLCGNWGHFGFTREYTGDAKQEGRPGSEDCKTCWRRRQKERTSP